MSWDFQINFNQLWCAASVDSLPLLSSRWAVQSSPESKHFHRCFYRLKVTSKRNDYLTRSGNSQGFTLQASFRWVIRDVPTWAVYHLDDLLSVCSSLDCVTGLVKSWHCIILHAVTQRGDKLLVLNTQAAVRRNVIKFKMATLLLSETCRWFMSEPADGKIRVAGSREVYQSILTEKAKKKGKRVLRLSFKRLKSFLKTNRVCACTSVCVQWLSQARCWCLLKLVALIMQSKLLKFSLCLYVNLESVR